MTAAPSGKPATIGWLLVGLATLDFASGCSTPKAGASGTETKPSALVGGPVASAAADGPIVQEEAKVLLRAGTSAYHARVFPGERETVVVTPTQVFRVAEDGTSTSYDANLGPLTTRLEDAIAFWREGALRSHSLRDGKERELVRLERQPRTLIAEGPRLAWLSEDADGRSTLETATAAASRRLYASKQELLVPVLHEGTVYFVERTAEGWRLARVALDGGALSFGESRATRPPPMLAAGPEGLYFYDGLKRGVRKASFDLRHEEPVNEEVICAPLAVSNRVVCAQVGGIVDLPRPNAKPRVVARELGGPIADLAVTETTAVWIADSGENRMTVRSVLLPSL